MNFAVKKIAVPGMILLMILTVNLQVIAGTSKKPNSLAEAAELSDVPEILSESGIIIDSDSKAVLVAKNENKKEFPASITKVMTVLLVLENADSKEKLTCSREAVMAIEPGSSHIGMMPEEELLLEDALRGILMASANELSNCVGVHVAGDMESFAELMTKRAKELGCKNTSFKNASGLHNDDHYTTAYDMSLILREAMKHELFREIVGTRHSQIPPTNLTEETRYLNNSNKLIQENSPYYYKNCTGGKTGFTKKAWHTLVNSADNGEIKLVSAVLRSQGRADKWTDTISWFDYCFEHFYNINLHSEQGDPEFNALKAFTENGRALITEGSTLKYLEPSASVTLPKEAGFADLQMKARILDNRQDRNLIELTYTYHDAVAGVCYVEEDLSWIREKSRHQEIMAEIQSLKETKKEKTPSGKESSVLYPAIIASIAVVISGGLLAFWLIRRKEAKGIYIFKSGKTGKNKFSFDKSLFKRH